MSEPVPPDQTRVLPPGLALFGTSADPPTAGHRALLAGLAAAYGEVVTWASDNPCKQHGAPLLQRAGLLQRLVDELADPRITLHQELSSPRALETLERAQALWPSRELVFVVGGDLAAQVPRWYRAAELLRRCRLAVVPRQGFALDPEAMEALRQLGGHPELLELPVPGTASSAVRAQPDPEQLPAAVWDELVKHNLYGLGQPRR
jgi:nicotinate-nucleotide adenylyltransferase